MSSFSKRSAADRQFTTKKPRLSDIDSNNQLIGFRDEYPDDSVSRDEIAPSIVESIEAGDIATIENISQAAKPDEDQLDPEFEVKLEVEDEPHDANREQQKTRIKEMLNLPLNEGFGAMFDGIKDRMLQKEIRDFFHYHNHNAQSKQKAGEDLDAFLKRPVRQGWADHAPRLTQIRDLFVSTVERLSDESIDRHLLDSKAMYGHVMDNTNPCLRFQHRKMGWSPYVRTQDTTPLREHYAKLAFSGAKPLRTGTSFLYPTNPVSAAYHDALLNAICEGAGVKVETFDCYLTRAEQSNGKVSVRMRATEGMSLRRKETQPRAELMPEDDVLRIFAKLFNNPRIASKIPEVDPTGSYLRRVVKYYVDKSRTIQSSAAWVGTEGHRRTAACRGKGLAKIKEIHVTNELKASEVAQRSFAAGRNALTESRAAGTNIKDDRAKKPEALLATKAVTDSRAKPENKRSQYEKNSCANVDKFDTLNSNTQSAVMCATVFWFSPPHPLGLHYEGDGREDCPGNDNTVDHPAVFFPHGKHTPKAKH
ncbi:hypothetical protein DL769_005149 [Monosporascus sp. CRB-8-3]|nr:hypothetical protein DL769_005149 [Monosporascus sp. CRB-8-3]